MALCNRLLRERYLLWLHDETKTRGTFNIFSHIHFETTLGHDKLGMSHQGVPDAFFDWCGRRQITPKSLSYYFEPKNERGKWEWKISKKASKVMKQVEQLKAYYRLNRVRTNTDLFSSILNNCPNLKKLDVANLPVDGYHLSNNPLTFSCKKGPYHLVDVEFSDVRFLSRDGFRKFVDACPNLENVKFDICEGIHILYLLNHANALKSIDACFSCKARNMKGPSSCWQGGLHNCTIVT